MLGFRVGSPDYNSLIITFLETGEKLFAQHVPNTTAAYLPSSFPGLGAHSPEASAICQVSQLFPPLSRNSPLRFESVRPLVFRAHLFAHLSPPVQRRLICVPAGEDPQHPALSLRGQAHPSRPSCAFFSVYCPYPFEGQKEKKD